MRKLLCLLFALVACFMLATVASATEVETTVPTTCQACNEEVTDWQVAPGDWSKLAGGHYHFYLDKNVSYYWLTPDKTADAVTICLDLNGYHNAKGGRVLGVYSGHTVNIMDSSADQTGYMEGKKGTNNLSGGSIFNFGTLGLYSGTLKFNSDGVTNHATYSGGVIAQYNYNTAVFNMYGGRVEGAQLVADDSGVSRGAAIYAVSGQINLYGGEVTSGKIAKGTESCIYLNKSGSYIAHLTLSGNANVDEIKPNSSSINVNIDGTYSGKARIAYASGITPSNGKKLGNATNSAKITGDLFCTTGAGWLVKIVGSQVQLATFSPSGEWHYCEHCKEVVRWTAMTTSNYSVPKSTPGDYHYYLSANSTSYVQLCKGANVCLDLYGKTLSRTGRSLLANGGSTLNLMDTVGGGIVRSTSGSDNERGGTITVSGTATMNMYGGTIRFTDKTGGKTRRGMVAIGGVLNMYGGKIEGAALTELANSYGGAVYLYLSNSVYGALNVYGGEITSGTVTALGPCVYLAEKACSVKLAGDAKVENIRFTANQNKLTVEGAYTGTASVTYPSSTELALGTQVGVSENATITGKITCTNNDLLVMPQDGKLVLFANAAATIVTENGRTNYDTLQDAMDAYEEGQIELVRSITEDVAVNKDVNLELGGKTVTGTVTVAEGKTLYVKDSQTDDYTVADGIYGKLTVSGNVKGQNGYLKIEEDGQVSFHKIEVAITHMTLRADKAGIYYKSSFLGDEKVAALVESFGVALSVIDVPYERNINTKCVVSEYTGFESGATGNAGTSTLVSGILKETNEEKINSRNLAMDIYGRPYIKTADGYIFGEPISRDLQQQLEAADALTEGLNASQWYGLEALYETYAAVLANVNTPNIRAGFEDDTLSLLMVGNSFCYYYVEELYGLLMANPDPGRGYSNVEIVNVYYSGCTLTKHHDWWVNDEAHYQVLRTNANGRKELTPSTGSAWRLEDTLQLGRWDFISLQGASSENNYSGATTEENVEKMIPLATPLLARFHELHPDAQLLWHRTWAFEVGRKSGSTTYTEDLLARYDAGMQAVCDWMCEEFDKDKPYDLQIVNSGVAWRLAREANALLETPLIPVEGGLCARLGVRNENTYPYYTGNKNAGDGYHDGDIGGAQFLNACVWYEKLTGQSVLDNPYKPTTTKGEFEVSGKYTLSDEFANLLRTAAHGVNEIAE